MRLTKEAWAGMKAQAMNEVAELRKDSPSLDKILKELNPTTKTSCESAAFYRDFNESLNVILTRMKDNAYMVWTVWQYKSSKQINTMDNILSELS
jgi:hypothetical protein